MPTDRLTSSVLVCTRNRRADLAACLDSLAGQTWLPDELLVIDSGDDGAEEVVAAFSRVVPRCAVHYLRSAPGLTRQRNTGIDAAHAQILHFIDDDTVLAPDYLVAIHDSFEGPEREDVVAVGGVPRLARTPHWLSSGYRRLFMWSPLDGSGRLLPSGFPSYTWRAPTNSEHATETLTGCSCSFRAGVFESLRFDESLEGYGFMEDVDLTYRVSRLGRMLVNPAATLVHLESRVARLDWNALTQMQIVNHARVHRRYLPHDPFHVFCFWWSELGAGLWRLADAALHRKRGVATGMIRGYAKVLLGSREPRVDAHAGTRGCRLPERQRCRKDAWAAARVTLAPALTGLLLFASLFTTFGGPWMEASGDQVGEWIGARAKALAAAGQGRDAAALYQNALRTPFQDPRQWAWRCDELVRLLTDQRRFREATDTAALLYARDTGYGLGAFRRVHAAMLAAGGVQDSADLAAWWAGWMSGQGHAEAAALGQIAQARALLALGAYEQASTAALAGFAVYASLETALEASRILSQGARGREALPLLEYVIARDNGEPKQQALEIRSRILDNR